ncbi:class I SAM-dependent DNA methyltransferase [Cognatiyoonia koreensis]|nr:methyltransferase domain-containing protein [Cognatiyoonia koreensis]
MAVYSDWAESYDADLAKRGYHTPQRVAQALRTQMSEDGPVLDFGCGTGLSGKALNSLGFDPIHGVDITAEMAEQARAKNIYERVWVGTPGQPPCPAGSYKAIVATGVISLGAAPPESLSIVLASLSSGNLLAFSFNDPTLEDGRYDAVLSKLVSDGALTILSREHGPHLDDMKMGADVIVARRN